MNAVVQYDLFKETTEEDVLKAELEALIESHHAVRKKAFSEIRALQKMVMDQQQELEYIKVKMGLACTVEPKEKKK